MAESRFPMTFDKCPYCGCTETIARLAWQEEAEKGSVDKDTFIASQIIKVPLIDLKKFTGVTARILLIYIDWCADPQCGRGYCVKAEIVSGPVQLMPFGKPPPGGPGALGGLKL
jgi:hypothetical protein